MTVILSAVLIAGLLHIICAGIAKAGRRDYDNANPRAWMARLEGYRARANAAQANTLEAQPFFFVAVVLALYNGAPIANLQVLMVAWLLLRLAYIGLYLGNKSTLRSMVWLMALGVNVAILFQAAPTP
jgi:uncharacterized MAPEG superfamily protein